MLDYELIFERKQHHLTTPQLHNRRLCFGNESIHKAISNQNPKHDLFITKYADDGIVQCIILDFDDKDNPKRAFKDAKKLQRFTQRNGLNTVIVRSGSKGYHCYIQLPPRAFGNDEYISPVNRELRFNKFQDFIIGLDEGKTYDTLDMTNTSAGLHGNIRLIGSIHPKTGNKCEIIDGEFIEEVIPNEFEWSCFERAAEYVKNESALKKKKQYEFNQKVKSKFGVNPIEANDLRELMPSIFGGDYKKYPKEYIMMVCPFHDDHSPSMVVTKEYYFCKTCHEKGNWFTLREKGYVDFETEKYIRVGKNGKNKGDKL